MKKQKVFWLGMLTCLVIIALVVGCCPTPTPEPTEEAEPTEEVWRVALVLPGSISDQGYNAAAYNGLMDLKEKYGAEVAYSESVPIAEFNETFRDYSEKGYDIVVGHGFEFGEPIELVAPDYPDTNYWCINCIVAGPNYASLLHQNQEGSYAAGYLAALMSETGKVAGVAGFEFPVIVQQMEGFRLGAQAARPDIEVTITYIGTFDDIAKGKEATLALISAGNDVVFHIADAAGIGVIEACQEEGVYAIGFAWDQNVLAPETVLTSTIVDFEEMMDVAMEATINGEFTMDVHKYGLSTGVVRLADFHGLVPDDIAAQVQDVVDQIIAGDLVVPVISEPSGQAEPTEKVWEVALVLPGSISDQGYNAAAYNGLMQIEEKYGAKVAYSESVPIAEYEETFRDYAEKGYDIVIGHGFQYGEIIEKVAPDYPDTTFWCINGVVLGPNYASLLHQNQEGSYVAGYMAALMSETGKVAGVAGFEFPVIVHQMEGFKLGAQAARPDIEVTIIYIGTQDDVAKGKEAGLALISAGTDVIFHIADASGIGVIEACQEEGVYAVGFAWDQNVLAPETVLTSTIIDFEQMMDLAMEAMINDEFTMEVHKYGLASGVVRLAEFRVVPDDIAAQAQEIADQIIAGDLVVPVP